MPFLFDAYNVYHAACRMSQEWAHLMPLDLFGLIARDMRRLQDAAIAVFDGAPPRDTARKVDPDGYVKVIYSGPNTDADAVLEKMIRKNSAPKLLTVVSSDNQVRRAARRRRATRLSASDYLAAMQRRMKQPDARPAEPVEKRKGLSEGELNEWLELFGIDPDEPTNPFSRVTPY